MRQISLTGAVKKHQVVLNLGAYLMKLWIEAISRDLGYMLQV